MRKMALMRSNRFCLCLYALDHPNTCNSSMMTSDDIVIAPQRISVSDVIEDDLIAKSLCYRY